jgi:hypothetical protein
VNAVASGPAPLWGGRSGPGANTPGDSALPRQQAPSGALGGASRDVQDCGQLERSTAVMPVLIDDPELAALKIQVLFLFENDMHATDE